MLSINLSLLENKLMKNFILSKKKIVLEGLKKYMSAKFNGSLQYLDFYFLLMFNFYLEPLK